MRFSDGIEYFPVTSDPQLSDQLRQQWDSGCSSRALAEFAAGLGLTPPEHPEGAALPKIVEVWPPGVEEGLLVWDVHQMEEADPEEYGEYPEEESPWGESTK